MSAKVCGFESCGKPHVARGLCGGHYQQRNRNEDLRPLRPRLVYDACQVGGCAREHTALGYCDGHYQQVRAGRTPEPLIYQRPSGWVTARNDLGQKRCGRCERWLDLSAFRDHGATSDGLTGKCSDCLAMVSIERRFNISEQFYRSLLAQQGGRCAIKACRATEPGGHGRWHVDHDHSCCPIPARSCGSCVRGLLCHGCNTALGLMADNPARLRAAADYLEASR